MEGRGFYLGLTWNVNMFAIKWGIVKESGGCFNDNFQ